jgi:hypothetical protein
MLEVVVTRFKQFLSKISRRPWIASRLAEYLLRPAA